MAFSVKAVIILLLVSSHFLRSILAKSEFDKGFDSPLAFAAVLAIVSAVVPFSTLPAPAV